MPLLYDQFLQLSSFLHLSCFTLAASYEDSGWGWNDKQKWDEMTEDKARYLIVRNQDDKSVALVHFRFDMDFEEAVLYW